MLHINYYICKVQYLFTIHINICPQIVWCDAIALFFATTFSHGDGSKLPGPIFHRRINRRDNGLFDTLCVKYAASTVIAIDISAGRGACEKSGDAAGLPT